jgi:hypothetical protein
MQQALGRYSSHAALIVFLFGCSAGLAAQSVDKTLSEQFAASNSTGQRALLATLNRERVAELDSRAVEDVLVQATESPSLHVRSDALSVIARLVPKDPLAAGRLARPDYLANLAAEGNANIAASAVELASLLHRDNTLIWIAVERRVLSSPVEPQLERRLIRKLSSRGEVSSVLRARLEEWAKTRDDAVGFESAVALGRLDPAPASLPAWLLRIASTKPFFAHPELIAPLERLKPLDDESVAQLKALKARFDTEVAKPLLDRDMSIYNDDLYRSVFDRTLDNVLATKD